MKKNSALKKLHKKEERLHHKAERAMEADERVHEKIEKVSKKASLKKPVSKGKKKIEKVMREFKEDKLHSGSKRGPVVKSKKQAIAIALSEARKAGAKIPKKKKK